MGKRSGIQYVDHSIGFWRGCHKIAPGCRLCYAEREMLRYGHDAHAVVRAKDDTFFAPRKWDKDAAAAGVRRRVFVTPWSDFWIAEADGWREEALDLIRACTHLDFISPSKRLDRAVAWLEGRVLPPNFWPLASVSVHEDLVAVVPVLNKLHTAVKGLSYEPAIGPLDLLDVNAPAAMAVDWIVAGCESVSHTKPGRPAQLDWFRHCRDVCQRMGIKFYLKQLARDGNLVHEPDLDGVKHLEYPAQGA